MPGKKPKVTRIEPDPELTPDQLLVKTVKRYSWYIHHGIEGYMRHLEKAIKSAEEIRRDAEENNPDLLDSAPYVAQKNMMEHIGQMVKEYKEVIDALKEAGLKY